MATKRRLEDLYIIGKEVTFDDGAGDAVTVWLQKLNPVELSTALRRANAARSRVLTIKNHPESEDYQAYWLEALDFDTETGLVEYLAAEDSVRIQERVEAELGSQDEWAKDGYLQGLRDLWEDGLAEKHAMSPDEESERVLAELTRFLTTANELAAPDMAEIRAELANLGTEDLRAQVFEKVLSYHGNSLWLEEFHRCELWKGVRDPKDKSYYFEKREDLNGLSASVLNRLTSEYASLSVDVVEGKGSEETPSSSNSSAAADGAATGASSGLVVVGQ